MNWVLPQSFQLAVSTCSHIAGHLGRQFDGKAKISKKWLIFWKENNIHKKQGIMAVSPAAF